MLYQVFPIITQYIGSLLMLSGVFVLKDQIAPDDDEIDVTTESDAADGVDGKAGEDDEKKRLRDGAVGGGGLVEGKGGDEEGGT